MWVSQVFSKLSQCVQLHARVSRGTSQGLEGWAKGMDQGTGGRGAVTEEIVGVKPGSQSCGWNPDVGKLTLEGSRRGEGEQWAVVR